MKNIAIKLSFIALLLSMQVSAVCVSQWSHSGGIYLDDSTAMHLNGEQMDNGACGGGTGVQADVMACPFIAKTGRVQEIALDLEVPGQGPALRVTRIYNGIDVHSGLLGNTWNFNFGRRIVELEGADFANEETNYNVMVRNFDGQKYRFKKSGDGSFVPALATMKAPFVLSETATGWEIADKDGAKNVFDSLGNLIEVTDLHKRTLRIYYDATTGCPDSAVNFNGNRIDFEYSPVTGKIDRIVNNFGHSASYEYDISGNLITVTYWDNSKITYTYDKSNYLTSVTDRTGRLLWDVSYDRMGKVSTWFEKGRLIHVSYREESGYTVTTEVDSLTGYVWEYYTNSQGVITKRVHPDGTFNEKMPKTSVGGAIEWFADENSNKTDYDYSDNGNLMSVTDPLNNTHFYTYNEKGLVETETNKAGITKKFKYNEDWQLIERIEALGTPNEISFQFTPDSIGQVLTMVDPNNNATQYRYDSLGNISIIIDSKGDSCFYWYDSLGQMVRYTDFEKNSWTYGYDVNGYLNTEVNPLNDSSFYNYDAEGRLLWEEDNKRRTTYRYDQYGRNDTIIYSNGDTAFYTYNYLGRPLSSRLPGKKPVYYSYTARGGVDSVIMKMNDTSRTVDSDDLVYHYQYDAVGNCTTFVNPDGERLRFRFDELNRMYLTINELDDSTHIVYDALGRDSVVILPNGNKIFSEFDEHNRLVKKYDDLGVMKEADYDNIGNLIHLHNPGSGTLKYHYNNINEVDSVQDELGFFYSYLYDKNGFQVETKDKRGYTSKVEFDEIGRLDYAVNETGDTTWNVYNDDGLLYAVVNEAGDSVVKYQYDELYRIAKKIYPDYSNETFQYDDAWRVWKIKNRKGDTTTFEYDDADRPIRRMYSDGTPNVEMAYYKNGRVKSINNGTALLEWEYDKSGFTTKYKQTVNGVAKSIHSSYSTQTNVLTMTYPSGQVVTKNFDARHRMTSVSLADHGELGGYEYDNRMLVKKRLGNGISLDYGYGPTGGITSFTYSHPTSTSTLPVIEYGYNDASETIFKKRLDDPLLSEIYTLDTLSQLVDFKRGEINELDTSISDITLQKMWEIDSRGNITSVNENGDITSHTYNNLNQPQELNWDKAGNLLSLNGVDYEWDADNKLKKAGNAIYSYDGLGRRIKKVTPAGTVTYVYDGWQVIEEIHDDKTLTFYYGIALDEILAIQEDDTFHYYLQDAQLNVVALTDLNGTIVESYTYTPYGTVTIRNGANSEITTSAFHNTYFWAGAKLDETSGLYYLRNRNYSVQLGRFVSADPIGLSGEDLNLYRYVENSPLDYGDPLGLFKIRWGSVWKGVKSSLTPSNIAKGVAIGAAITVLTIAAPCVAPIATIAMGTMAVLGNLGTIRDGIAVATGYYIDPMSGEMIRQICDDERSELLGSVMVDVAMMAIGAKVGKKIKLSCFVAGTMVLTDKGLVAIEDIKKGDVVLSLNVKEGIIEKKKVLSTFSRDNVNTLYVEYEDADGEKDTISTTAEHPFWVKGKDWVRADELVVGDSLRTPSGAFLRVSAGTWTQSTATVYNFEVADNNNYFVGDDSVLVHNTKCDADDFNIKVKQNNAVSAQKTSSNYTAPNTRSRNRLTPHPKAQGSHSSFRYGPDGRVSNYETYDLNPYSGKYGASKRFRGRGKPHEGVEPPFVLSRPEGKGVGATPSVVGKPEDWELPTGYDL